MATPIFGDAFRGGGKVLGLFGARFRVGPAALPSKKWEGSGPVFLKEPGAVISGIDFRGREVIVQADNVTIRECLFDDTGLRSITQSGQFRGLCVEFCFFDSQAGRHFRQTKEFMASRFSEYIQSDNGLMTVQNNIFLDAPSDGINVVNGIVQRNAFVGAYFSKDAHADAISCHRTTGGLTIRENYINYILHTPKIGTNACVKIVSHAGPINDVTIDKNVLIGGGYNTYIGPSPHPVSNVRLTNNLMGSTEYGDSEQSYIHTFNGNHGAAFVYSGNAPFSGAPADVVSVSTDGTQPAPPIQGLPVAPTCVSKPTIEGDLKVGGRVATRSGTWKDLPAGAVFSWVWRLGNVPIEAAKSHELTIPAAGSLTVSVGVKPSTGETVWSTSDPVTIAGAPPTVPPIPPTPPSDTVTIRRTDLEKLAEGLETLSVGLRALIK